MGMTIPLTVTPKGYIATIWPVGASFFLAPFYFAAVFLKALLPHAVRLPPIPWFILFTNAGAGLYGLAAVWLAHRGLKASGASLVDSISASLLVFLGTPLFYYTFCLPNSPHAVAAFAAGLFLLRWTAYARREDSGALEPFFLGLLLGLASMVRTEDAVFAAAPLIEWADRAWSDPARRPAILRHAPAFAAGWVAGFSPQAVCWTLLFGSPLHSPQAFNLSWANFAPAEMLFSPFHGVACWTPLLLVGIAGLLAPGPEFRQRACLFLACALKIMVCSFAVAWWDGDSFGQRVLTGCFFPAAVGLGAAFRWTEGRGRRWVLAGSAASALWTWSLALQADVGMVDLNAFVYHFREIWAWQERLPRAFLTEVRNFFGTVYPSAPEALLVLAVLFAAVWTARAWSRKAERSPAFPVLALLAAVLFFNGWMVAVHLRRRGLPPGREALPPSSELSRLFLHQALYGRWYYYLKRGEYEEAREAIERHLQVSPGFKPALEALELVEIEERRK